jgi:hypothetical protein
MEACLVGDEHVHGFGSASAIWRRKRAWVSWSLAGVKRNAEAWSASTSSASCKITPLVLGGVGRVDPHSAFAPDPT